MSYRDISFGELFRELMEHYIEANDYAWIYDVEYESETAEFLEKILYNFEIYGGFLDDIPKEDWVDIIEGKDGLIKIALRYTRKPTDLELKEVYVGTKRPLDQIEKDLRTIEKFGELVYGIVERIEELEGVYVPPYMDKIEASLEAVELLADDLVKQKFEIFPRTNYYKWEVTTKTEISNFIDDLIAKYNLEGCSIDKDQLISSLPK